MSNWDDAAAAGITEADLVCAGCHNYDCTCLPCGCPAEDVEENGHGDECSTDQPTFQDVTRTGAL